MKFELTRTEYRQLTELIYIGEWIINAHRGGEENPQIENYKNVIQKLFAYAPKLGLSRWIEYVPETDSYMPTRKMEEKSPCEQYMEEYKDHTFWQELCARLVRRDLVREMGQEAVVALSDMERVEQLIHREQVWMERFVEDGLDCLAFKKATREDGDQADSETV